MEGVATVTFTHRDRRERFPLRKQHASRPQVTLWCDLFSPEVHYFNRCRFSHLCDNEIQRAIPSTITRRPVAGKFAWFWCASENVALHQVDVNTCADEHGSRRIFTDKSFCNPDTRDFRIWGQKISSPCISVFIRVIRARIRVDPPSHSRGTSRRSNTRRGEVTVFFGLWINLYRQSCHKPAATGSERVRPA